LRSHLHYLPELDVRWYYLANQPAANSQCKWLGPRLTTTELLSDLSARSGFLPGSKSRTKNLVEQMDADLYWVVGHYEGISVAAELIAQGKRVHLTIHDDPFGTWTRSQRYRMFRPLLRNTFPAILRAAQSIDVTSWGMRNLYRQKYGVQCFALYLCIAALPQVSASPDPRYLTIGHIGTLSSATVSPLCLSLQEASARTKPHPAHYPHWRFAGNRRYRSTRPRNLCIPR